MKSPITVKEVQRLIDCIASFSEFMSKSVDICSVFFRTLIEVNFKWDSNWRSLYLTDEIPYQDSKVCITLTGDLSFLYISMSDHSLSVVLVVEQHMSLYYISHAFKVFEAKYSKIEKVVYALVMASWKFKPYFQSHPVRVLNSWPMNKINENKY